MQEDTVYIDDVCFLRPEHLGAHIKALMELDLQSSHSERLIYASPA